MKQAIDHWYQKELHVNLWKLYLKISQVRSLDHHRFFFLILLLFYFKKSLFSFLKHCSDSRRPAPKITWKKNNSALVHGRDSFEISNVFQGRLLNIVNVRKDIHEGQYSCEAENSQNAGSPIKHNINLQFEGKGLHFSLLSVELVYKNVVNIKFRLGAALTPMIHFYETVPFRKMIPKPCSKGNNVLKILFTKC